jgi:phenylpropionate dioxygenase-like ring-hydroxylating dioxygenase large terminal subunit
VFVNADLDAAPLSETLGELPEVFAARGGSLERLVFRRRIASPVNGNWKLFVENALECYHCPIAHPGFSAVFNVHPDVYKLATYRYFSTHTTVLAEPSVDQARDKPGFHFYFLWPNFFISADDMQCELTYLRAVDERNSVAVSEYHFDPAIDEDRVEERIGLTQATLSEDLALIESQQVGHDSDTVQVGRLLPESEKLLRHFGGLVAETLFDAVT